MQFWNPDIREFRFYEETVDNIIGILHAKDVMIEMRKKRPEKLRSAGY